MSIFEIRLPESVIKALMLPTNSPGRQQAKVLRKLLRRSKYTSFGMACRFDEILSDRHPERAFQQRVPIHDYNGIHQGWWHRTLQGEADVCWPGRIKYFALSSGTSEAASKYIPVTRDLIRGNRIVMIKQLLSLRHYQDVAWKNVGKGFLMLGGSTDLQKGPGYYAGDLSGITAKKVPFWFSPFYKPGKRIARTRDWNLKLEEVVRQAPNWDIGFVVGVPAWIQMCIEMIIERYGLKHIHEIWPRLTFFVHGGVAFEPYRKGFERLLERPLVYIETYLASEGFIAYQDRQVCSGMRLVTNEHIFLEFIPFDERNFDSDGNLCKEPQTLLIDEVEEGRDYAILLSTTAGAWRYLIGDTIRFTDLSRSEIVITGRTKHFLSLVGEHLSVDNMNHAVRAAGEALNVVIPEFTVAGAEHGNFFAHHWYVACDEPVDAERLREIIDGKLRELNDDYAVERGSALKEVRLEVLREADFLGFLGRKGKIGGQHKFPRVLKGGILEEWKEYLASR